MMVVFSREIDHCYHQCPHFGIDGGPGAVMVCNHPKAPDHGNIISHPECDTGFPPKCPLLIPEIDIKTLNHWSVV